MVNNEETVDHTSFPVEAERESSIDHSLNDDDHYETVEEDNPSTPASDQSDEDEEHENSTETDSEKSELSEISEHHVAEELEDHLQDFLIRNPVNPENQPYPGDIIQFLDMDTDPPAIVQATVKPMVPHIKRKWKTWVNILRDGTSRISSVNLEDVRWTFVENQIPQETIHTRPFLQFPQRISTFMIVHLIKAAFQGGPMQNIFPIKCIKQSKVHNSNSQTHLKG